MTHEGDPTNLRRLPSAQPLTPARMAAWFAKLAGHLGTDAAIVPEAFLVVLLNAEQIRVYSSGSPALLDDAAQAAQDDRQRRRASDRYGSPEEERRKRRDWKAQQAAQQAAHEASRPFRCDACGRRYKTPHTYARHQARCWSEVHARYCVRCERVWANYHVYRDHPCLTEATTPTPGAIPVMQIVRGDGR